MPTKLPAGLRQTAFAAVTTYYVDSSYAKPLRDALIEGRELTDAEMELIKKAVRYKESEVTSMTEAEARHKLLKL